MSQKTLLNLKFTKDSAKIEIIQQRVPSRVNMIVRTWITNIVQEGHQSCYLINLHPIKSWGLDFHLRISIKIIQNLSPLQPLSALLKIHLKEKPQLTSLHKQKANNLAASSGFLLYSRLLTTTSTYTGLSYNTVLAVSFSSLLSISK